MHEECGVFGIYMNDATYDPAEAAYLGLYALQHRGQESAGIAVTDGQDIRSQKGMGLCAEVFRNTLSAILLPETARSQTASPLCSPTEKVSWQLPTTEIL